MSKHLRTFLLSVLAVVLVASSAFADGIVFEWNGSKTNFWGETTNWTAYPDTAYWTAINNDTDLPDPITYDDVQNMITTESHLGSSEFYPGKFAFIDGSAYNYVNVVIRKDADISMSQYDDNAGLSVGRIQNIDSIFISGNEDQTAHVKIRLGNSYFAWAPRINVDGGRITVNDENHAGGFASLEISGNHVPAVTFEGTDDAGNPNFWNWNAGNGANLTLDFPVRFNDGTKLNLNIVDSVLTIKNNTLIDVAGTGYTVINVVDNDADDAFTARPVFDIAGSPVNSGRYLSINLAGGANRVDAAQPITLRVYSDDENVVNFGTYAWPDGDDEPTFTDNDDDTDHTFVKGGAATLTLEKTAAAYKPVLSKTTAVTVSDGTLAFRGAGYSVLGAFAVNDDDSMETVPTFTVESGASLDVGTRTIDTYNGDENHGSNEVHFLVRGNLILRDKAIDAGDRYTLAGYTGNDRWLNTMSFVTLDVRDGGVVRFEGDQGISALRGAGTITSAPGKILFLNCGSEQIKNFTGKLESIDIAILNDWDTIPFLGTNKKTTGRIGNIYVIGWATEWDTPDGNWAEGAAVTKTATLTLDQAQLKRFNVTSESLDKTTIYLRSDRLGGNREDDLLSSFVGNLNVSGDISLNEVKIDGTKNANGIAHITFDENAYAEDEDKESSLTVNTMYLHANSDRDFNASSRHSSGENIYINAYAVIVNGLGTFTPKNFVNETRNDGTHGVHVGTDNSVTVQNKTTLVLGEGVQIPHHNSLTLQGATLNVEETTIIPGNFTIENYADDTTLTSKIYVPLTESNDRSFAHEDSLNAIRIGGTMTIKTNNNILVEVVKLLDPVKFLGKTYGIIGAMSLSSDTSIVNVPDGVVPSLVLDGYFTKEDDNGADDAIRLNYDNKGIYAQLANWFIQPVLSPDWTWLRNGDGEEGFGGANKQFAAWIGYGISDDVSPDLSPLVTPSIRVFYNGNLARSYNERNVDAGAVTIEGGRHRIAYVDENGKQEDLAFMQIFTSNDNGQNKLYVSGTSYKTSLDVRIDLRWTKTGTTANQLIPGAVVTYKVTAGGSLGREGAFNMQNAPVRAIDLFNLYAEKRVMVNRYVEGNDVPKEDIYTRLDTTATSSVVFRANEDAKFEFRVDGFTKTTTTSTLPTLVNGEYVWNNGYDTSSTYTITSGDTVMTVTDIKVLVNNVAVNMDSVDIEADGTGVRVSVPVSLLGSTSGSIPEVKTLEVTAKTTDGRVVHITAPSVTLVPASYTAGTPAQATYSFTEGKIPTAEQVVTTGDLSGDDVQYIILGNAPAGITWNNAAGAIAYTLAPNTAPGNYDVTVYAYNGTQTYGYTFTIAVAEGFRVRFEVPYTDYYANTNYVAYFTASNAPEGDIAWTTSTLPSWLKTTKSGDVFVVYGQLPAYDGSEYEDVDPNAVSFTVTATVASETQNAEIAFTVAEDTNEKAEPAASAVTSASDIYTVTRNYNVAINYTADDYGSEITDFNLPYWIVATPVLGGDDGDQVRGYTLSFRTGADVANGATGVVRYTNVAGNLISWAVTFADEAFTISASQTSFTLAAGATATVTMTAANNLGTVTYTSNQTWAVVDGSTVTITAPAATATVTITGTDSGRTENATATATITVNVTTVTPPTELEVAASETSLSLKAGATATVTLSANKTGVTYTSNQSWAVVDGSTVTITAPSATATVTITGTDSDGNTDTVDITVNVTPTVEVPVVTALTLISDDNTESATVQADRDIPEDGWAVYVNGSVETWATIAATGARTATVTLDVPLDLEPKLYTITVTATDANGTSSRTSVGSFTVENYEFVGSSSGGCDAGFGAMALLFAAPLFLRRRRS